MKKAFVISILFMLFSFSFSFGQELFWSNTYGGPDNESGNSVCQTDNGGYIAVGRTWSYGAGQADFYVVATDENGNELWYETFGGSDFEEPEDIKNVGGGAFVIVGRTKSFGAGDYDIYVVKMAADGSEIWSNTYGTSGYDDAYSVVAAPDGSGYLIVGSTNYYGGVKIYLIKVSPDGDLLWERTIAGSSYNDGYYIDTTSDGNYIISGDVTRDVNSDYDVYLSKVDPSGNQIWSVTYDSPSGTADDEGFCVHETSDGGFIVSGRSGHWYSGDALLLKTDADGNILWTRQYNFYDYGDECSWSVTEADDGGFILTGEAGTGGWGSYDLFLIKTNSVGNLLWAWFLGGNEDEHGACIIPTNDGNYAVVGESNSYGDADGDLYLLKFSQESIEEAVSIDMAPNNPPVVVPPGGSFTYTGYLTNNTEQIRGVDIWIMLDVPGIGLYGPIMQMNNISLDPYQNLSGAVTQDIPIYAPAGTYKYIAYCGDYNNFIYDSTWFEFTVTNSTQGNSDSWELACWNLNNEIDNPIAQQLPQSNNLRNYPNPFNAQTSISFDVPTADNISLEIYNIMGQKVATLVNGNIEAGTHTVVWNAGDYSSGIYFYKLTAGNKVFTKRMTLLK